MERPYETPVPSSSRTPSPVEPLQELVEQPGLADPRLADQQHDRALASRRPAGNPVASRRARDRVRSAGSTLAPETPPAVSVPTVSADTVQTRTGSVFPLTWNSPRSSKIEIAVRSGAACSRLSDDLAGLGDVQEPRGEVGGVAHRRVVHAQVTPDGAHHHRTGIDADPDPEVDAVTSAARDREAARGRPWMPSAARSARWAWSSWAIGAPKSAITPSPRNWLIVPS